jgi:hypothetical protein
MRTDPELLFWRTKPAIMLERDGAYTLVADICAIWLCIFKDGRGSRGTWSECIVKWNSRAIKESDDKFVFKVCNYGVCMGK